MAVEVFHAAESSEVGTRYELGRYALQDSSLLTDKVLNDDVQNNAEEKLSNHALFDCTLKMKTTLEYPAHWMMQMVANSTEPAAQLESGEKHED